MRKQSCFPPMWPVLWTHQTVAFHLQKSSAIIKFKRRKIGKSPVLSSDACRGPQVAENMISNKLQSTAKHTNRGSFWSRVLTTRHAPFTVLRDAIGFRDWRLRAEAPLAAGWPEPTTSKHNSGSLSRRGRAPRPRISSTGNNTLTQSIVVKLQWKRQKAESSRPGTETVYTFY